MRRAVWVLVILGAVAVLQMLVAAVAGDFSVSSQYDFFEKLGFWGFVAFILIEGSVRGFGEFQSQKDWLRWDSLVPLAAIVVSGGGIWLWWIYFGRHHATVIWFVIVGGVMAALMFFHQMAERERARRTIDGKTKLPEIPNISGPSNPDDFKDW